MTTMSAIWVYSVCLHDVVGADPGFLKGVWGGGGVHLRSRAKKRGGGVQEGVQLWAQC